LENRTNILELKAKLQLAGADETLDKINGIRDALENIINLLYELNNQTLTISVKAPD
jgi:hypothetical protein